MRVTTRDSVAAVILAAAIVACTAACSFHVVLGGAARPAVATDSAASPAAASDMIHCDGAICSLYLSRAQTQELSTNSNLVGGGVAALAVACTLFTLMSGPASVIMPIVCAVGLTSLGSFFLNAASRAAEDNGCLRAQLLPLAFYDDHSRYCHNT
jgi:hypothetical protein